MLVDYSVTEMGCFGDYLDAVPRAKTMMANGSTTFLLHVSQFITFNKTRFATATLIVEAQLKSLYSILGFKVTKYFATYTNFERSHKRFHYESGKFKATHICNCVIHQHTLDLIWVGKHNIWYNMTVKSSGPISICWRKWISFLIIISYIRSRCVFLRSVNKI